MKRNYYCGYLFILLILAVHVLNAQPAVAQNISTNVEQPSTHARHARLIDATNGMTADDLVRLALSRNGELAAARKTIDQMRGLLRQAGLKPNPMIEASGSQAVANPDQNLMIGIELPLELRGRRQARVSVAQRELEIREAEVRDFERRLAAEVRMKYAEAIAAARNFKFTEDLLRLIRDSHRLIRASVELGKSAPLEQNLVWVELNKTDAQRIGFASKAETAMLELKKVVGLLPDEPLQLRGELIFEGKVPPQSEALRLALESRPDLAALRAGESLAAAQAEQARVEGKIDASIFANYQRMNLGYDIRGFNNAGTLVPVAGVFHYATFGVRLTLPARNKNQGNIEAAIAAAEAARRRREFAELVVRNEVASVYARLERADAAVALYRDRVRESAIRNVDVLRQAFTLGQRTMFDYLAEQRRFIEIETGYTDLLKEKLNVFYEIERVTGNSMVKDDRKIEAEN